MALLGGFRKQTAPEAHKTATASPPSSGLEWYAIFFTCALCSLALAWPVLSLPDWYTANQAYRYPYLLDMFARAFSQGQWYPRWLPDLMGGYGYPTFVYYPPGFWFVALPLTFIIASAPSICKIVIIIMLFGGGVGCWKLARHFTNAQVAFWCCLLFYAMPQIQTCLILLGALSELMALMLLPWLWRALFLLIERYEARQPCFRSAIALSLWAAALIYTHFIVTVWTGLALALTVLYTWRKISAPQSRYVVILCSCTLLSLSLSSPYWYSAYTLMEEVTYNKGIQDRLTYNTMPLSELLGFHSGMVGLLQPILAIPGLWLARRKAYTLPSLFTALYALFYMLPAANFIRDAFPLLGFLQWPARIAPVLIVPFIIGCACTLQHTQNKLKKSHFIGFASLCMALCILAASAQNRRPQALNYREFFHTQATQFQDMTHTGEFMPVAARIDKLLPVALIRENAYASSTPYNPMNFIEPIDRMNLRLVMSPTTPSIVIVNQFYFPGWRASINGKEPSICDAPKDRSTAFCLDRSGRLLIRLEPGNSQEIRVWYDGVPDAWLRNLLSAIAALIAVISLRLCDRLNPRRHILAA